MRLSKAWVIARNELSIIRKTRTLLYTLVLFPLFIAILLPLVIPLGILRNGVQAGAVAALPNVLFAFSFFFVIAAATIPSAIASYSIVGEKMQKSLEPLLATPTTDGEILFGKSIAAIIPTLISILLCAVIFMVNIDIQTNGVLGYLFFPNWNAGLLFLVLAPIVAVFSVETSVLVSSKANDVRTAQQLGGTMFIPFIIIYVATEIGVFTLDVQNLLLISLILLIADLVLFYVSTSTFKREEILTKWS